MSDKTVTAQREGLESASEIPKVDSTTGKDGKTYPRKQKPPEPEAETVGEISHLNPAIKQNPRHITGGCLLAVAATL